MNDYHSRSLQKCVCKIFARSLVDLFAWSITAISCKIINEQQVITKEKLVNMAVTLFSSDLLQHLCTSVPMYTLMTCGHSRDIFGQCNLYLNEKNILLMAIYFFQYLPNSFCTRTLSRGGFGLLLVFNTTETACSSLVKRTSNKDLAYAPMSFPGICRRLISSC